MTAAVASSAGRGLLRRGQLALVLALVALTLLVVAMLFAGVVAPADPLEQDILHRFAPPGDGHLLGTDELGRDVASRLVHGARVSLLAGLEALGIAFTGGLALGLVAGWVGGFVDRVLSRLNDALMSLPGLVLALAFVTVLGPSIGAAMFAVGLVFIPRFFRVTRATTLSVRERPFIEGLVAIGARPSRIVVRHVVPNILGPLVVEATIVLSASILAEASLSFLGLAAQPPTPSWGSMLSSAQQRPDLLHLVIAPGAALTVTILALTVVGDHLRDVVSGVGERRGRV